MHIDGARVDRVLVFPDVPEESIAGDRSIWMPEQILEQVELFRFECHRFPINPNDMSGGIEFDRTESLCRVPLLHRRRLSRSMLGKPMRSAEICSYASHELTHDKRFS